jgi:hypothetical protein
MKNAVNIIIRLQQLQQLQLLQLRDGAYIVKTFS